MKIAQFSDLHYANETLLEVDCCMGTAVDVAIARGVELAVVSGDATDHGINVHAPAFVALAKQIRRLADHCPVLMLQGTFSHEPPGTLDVFRMLGGRYPVFVADRIGQAAWCGEAGWVASEDWCFTELPVGARALFTCLPTVNKADIAAIVGVLDAASAVGEQLALLLAGYGQINAKARAHGVPTIGVSHGTVNGCITEHGVPMAGMDHEFTVATLFAAKASAVMLGHIHKHQHWEQGGQQIAYPGSIGRLHYGEEDAKGFLLWEVSAPGAEFEFIETPARRMLHFTFAGKPDLEVLRLASQGAQGAFVRVRWEVAEEDRAGVDRQAVADALAGAAEVKLEGRVIPVLRARAEGISRTASLAAKLDRWATLIGVDSGALTSRLEVLSRSTTQVVAREVLQGIHAAEHPSAPALEKEVA